MRFSFVTVLGVLFSVGLLGVGVLEITGTIDFSNYVPLLEQYQYLNLPSLFIVLGGVLNSIFLMYPARYVGKALLSIFKLFSQSKTNLKTLKKDVKMIISWAQRVKSDKLNAYESIQKEHEHELPSFLFSLASTNYSTDEIEEFGATNIEESYKRKLVNVEVLSTMGSASPAFGMFGTLFGLIVMLGELQNPAAMGPGLAAALITTLYGISLAHLIFFPLARKLRNMAQIARFREYLILEGVMLINDNKSPFYIQDRLSSYLKREYSFDMDAQQEELENAIAA